MKKPIFLLVAALSAASLSPAIETALSPIGAADDAAAFSESQAENFLSFFGEAYSYDLAVDGYDYLGTGISYAIEGEVSSSARTSRINMSATLGSMSVSQDVSFVYGVRGSDGNAYLRSLSTSNTTFDTAVADSNSDAVAFEEAFPTFFDTLLTVATSAFATYFGVESNAAGYLVTPTALGLARLSEALDLFLPGLVPYNFDAKTHSVSYLDLGFQTDAEGTPTGLFFSRLDLDRFGGIRGNYVFDLAAIDEVSPYPTVVSKLDEAGEAALSSAFANLAAGMAGGNFTTDIEITYTDGIRTYEYLSYSNYYDLFGLGLMLTSNALEDSENGTTFTGLWADEEGTQFIPIAISPETETFALIIGSDYSQIFTDVADAVPTIGNLSTAFFEKVGDDYVYEIEGNVYADYLFQMELLCDLLGVGDYYSRRYSSSVYQLDSSGYELGLKSLSVSVAESYPVFTLAFDTVYGIEFQAEISFGSFGTTDLSTVVDAQGQPLFADALAVYDLYDRIPTTM